MLLLLLLNNKSERIYSESERRLENGRMRIEEDATGACIMYVFPCQIRHGLECALSLPFSIPVYIRGPTSASTIRARARAYF